MKGSRAALMIGISTVSAIAAVMLASQWMAEQSTLSTRRIAVAAGDINPGTRLVPDLLRMTEWPAGSVPEGAFANAGKLDSRVVHVALQRGEPLLESKLAPPGATGGLSAIVAPGKRAMTVRVNDVVGVAGFALPGNFVDILVSTRGDKPDNREQSISKLVLERILVLAVAQDASLDDTAPRVVNAVTLEVTPEQAETLDLARSVGKLSLVLRNQLDVKPAETDGATKATLLASAESGTAQKKAVPVIKKVKKVRVVKKRVAPKPKQCQQVMTGAGPITRCY